MNPDDRDHLLLAAYIDGELSPGETVDMERRLREEPALRALRQRLEKLSGSVRAVVEETHAPSGFAEAMSARFSNVEVMTPPSERRRWPSIAAALLVGILAGGAAGFGLSHLQSRSGEARIVDAIYAGHLRGLAAPQPFDIASSDRHVVKPWFNGRTAIAPDAPDLADQGYPLAGGRVDIIGETPVPTLVYRRRQHVVSVTVVPKAGMPATDAKKREGSNIERWDAGDLSYFAVSDLNLQELNDFITLYRARTAPHP